MKPNGKCMWIYFDGKCECNNCKSCPHYRPDYAKEKEFLEDLLIEQQEQM